MKKVGFVAYPFASQYGEVSIPDDIPESDYEDYIREHLKEVELGDPNLFYFKAKIEVDSQGEM